MTGLTYRSEIDGLRAIAVLSVVLCHAGVAPRAGFVGVDIFFVISGYLITALLMREHDSTGRIDLLAFYARRVRRIFPAAMVVILVVVCLGGILLPSDLAAHTAESAAAAVLFVANFFFQAVTGGYFDASAEEMPLLHLWSLSVEEQFYLLWPTLLILLLRWRPAALLKILVGLAIASLVLAEWLMYANPHAAFYQMPARFWELALGGVVALLPRMTRAWPWVATGALVCCVMTCFIPIAHFPGAGALPVVAATAILLWTVHQGGDLGFAGQVLRSPPLVGVGLISYSLYLWHWPLLAIYRANSIVQGSTLMRLSLCALAMILAIASYRYVEQPLRHARWLKGRLLAVGTTLSLVVALAVCTYGYNAQFERKVDNPLAVKAENDMPSTNGYCRAQLYSPVQLGDGCETINGHPVGVLLWGDSMAFAWEPLSDRIGQQKQQSAMDYSRAGCGPFLIYLPDNPHPTDHWCREWNAQVVERARRADTVILVAQWSTYSIHTGMLRILLHATLAQLASVPHVVILGPTPEMRDSVARCIRAGNLDACAISRTQYDAWASPLMTELRAAAAGMSNVQIVDTSEFFCTANACPPMKHGYSLYWDSHHVSYTAATAYASEYSTKLFQVERNRLGAPSVDGVKQGWR